MASSPTTEKAILYALLGMTAVTGLVDAVSFLSLGHVFTREHDGECRASRVRKGARTRTVHRTLANRTRGFSCGGDTRRTGHGPVEW
jgi:hypothetical protein